MTYIQTLFPRASVATRLQSGLFGPYAEELAVALVGQRLATDSIRRALYAADQFGHWLFQQGLTLTDVERATVDRYLYEMGRCPSGARPHATQGLHHAVQLLQRKDLLQKASDTLPIPAEQWLRSFEDHHRRVAGAAEGTIRRYRSVLRRFLRRRHEKQILAR